MPIGEEVAQSTTEAEAPIGGGESAPAASTPHDSSPRGDIKAAIEKLSANSDQARMATKEGGARPKIEIKPKLQTGKTAGNGATDVQTPLKPPGAWKPDAREKWASLAPELQQEIKRIEAAWNESGSKAAPALKFHEEFSKLIAPYDSLIQAESAALGIDGSPLKAFERYLQTATALRTAHPEAKARMVVGVAGQYGVPPDALIAFLLQSYGGDLGQLDRQVAARLQGQQPNQQRQVDPNQLIDQAEQRLATKYESLAVKQKTELYASKLPDFIEKNGLEVFGEEDLGRLKESMATAIERGLAEDFDDALEVAVAFKSNKDIRDVLEQRKAAKAAGKSTDSTLAAKRAASPVRGSPAGPRPQPAKSSGDFNSSRKDDIRAAIASLASVER